VFVRLGRFVVRTRVALLVAGLIVVIVGGAWGSGVTATGVLSQGGLEDRNSESFLAMERIGVEVGRQDADVIALYTNRGGPVADAAFEREVTAALGRTAADANVERVISPFDRALPAAERAALRSKDGGAAYAVVQLRGADDDQRMQSYLKMKKADGGNPLVVQDAGVQTELGGIRPLADDINSGITDGAKLIEMVTIPTLFILLLFVFGGLVAASIPLIIAVLALVGGLIVLRLLNGVTDVSVFALNVIMFMALGLAVDYGLFMVSRFREEVRAGFDVHEAVARTMQTAGRTVLVSGITVTLALTGVLFFPQAYVRSMGLAGMIATFLAMLTSLTVLPAFLAVVGRKIDSLRIPQPWRRGRSPGETRDHGGWGRVAEVVTRRPGLLAAGVVAVLLLLAAPALRVNFGISDESSLAKDAGSRVVAERLTEEFAVDARKSVYVLVSGDEAATPAQVRSAGEQLAGQIAAVPGVDPQTVRLSALRERVEAGRPGASAVVTASHRAEWSSDQALEVVRAVRALPTPDGTEVLVGGLAAGLQDQNDGLADKLPLMAVVVLVVTLIFLFFAFGSVLLPPITILVNLVSIVAAFGPIVWIFQSGHLSGLLDFTATGMIPSMETVLVLAFAFGLSMDYSVFLLSRIREEWDATHDVQRSIVAGVQRTGGIITSAGVLLAVTIGSFVLVEVKDLKFIAIGLFVIILLDATLVRMVLMPAILKLLGPAAWWMPGPLRGLYATYGIRETAGPGRTAARHAVLAGDRH
jgi:trehalose monomycolate/heme transporter